MAWKPPLSCDPSGEVFGEKRTTMRDALWQNPKNHNASPFSSTDDIWFCSIPLGKHKLENLLTNMCKKAGLAQVYTPHYIRATSVTVLKAAGLETCRVKSVTGHANDKSIESYSHRTTNHRAAVRVICNSQPISNAAEFCSACPDIGSTSSYFIILSHLLLRHSPATN